MFSEWSTVNLNYSALLPEIILSVTGIMIMLVIPFVSRDRQVQLGYPTLAGIAVAFLSLVASWDQRGMAFFEMVFQDPFALFLKVLFLFTTARISVTTVMKYRLY